MNAQAEQLLEKLQALPPERRAEVEDFVDFLATKARKRTALDRLCVFHRCRPSIPREGGHGFRRMPAGSTGGVTVRERGHYRQASSALVA